LNKNGFKVRCVPANQRQQWGNPVDLIEHFISKRCNDCIDVIKIFADILNILISRYFNGSNPPVELVPAGNPPALTTGQRDCVVKVQVTLDAISANPNPHNPTPLHSQAASQVAIRNRALGNF